MVSQRPHSAQTPGFPYFIALLWRLGRGSMDFAAHATIWLNVLFSALTYLVLIAIGNKLRPGRGLWFGLTWALFPLLGFSEVSFLWDTSLYTLVLSTVIWLLLVADGDERVGALAGWGVVAGLSLLLNPSHMLVIACILAFLLLNGDRGARIRGAAATIAVVMTIAPWVIRNSLAFEAPTFIRSNVGYELYRGLLTSPEEGDRVNAMNPGREEAEFARFAAAGERDYMKQQSRLARELVTSRPALVVTRGVSRFGAFWAGNPEVQSNGWPVGIGLKHLLFLLPGVAGAWGLVLLLRGRDDRLVKVLFTSIILVFPLPYYVALTMPRYRAPIEPMLAVLAVSGVLRLRAGPLPSIGKAAVRSE